MRQDKYFNIPNKIGNSTVNLQGYIFCVKSFLPSLQKFLPPPPIKVPIPRSLLRRWGSGRILTPKLSNLVPEKILKTASHSNYYLKLTICAKRLFFQYFMKKWGGGGGESWHGKVEGKIVIRVQFVFHFPSPPLEQKSVFWVILLNIHPCKFNRRTEKE